MILTSTVETALLNNLRGNNQVLSIDTGGNYFPVYVR
jgi:hypothetical protein